MKRSALPLVFGEYGLMRTREITEVSQLQLPRVEPDEQPIEHPGAQAMSRSEPPAGGLTYRAASTRCPSKRNSQPDRDGLGAGRMMRNSTCTSSRVTPWRWAN